MFRLLCFIVVFGFYDAVVFFRINLFEIYFAIDNFFFAAVGFFRINLFDISFARDNFFFAAIGFFRINLFDISLARDNFFFAAVVLFRINLFAIRNSDKANHYATNNVYKRDGNKDIFATSIKKGSAKF